MTADSPVRTLFVLDVDLPNPEAVADVVAAIDPPSVPHFAGTLRIAVAPASTAVTNYLDDELVTLSPLLNLEGALNRVEGIHHFHGSACLCGYESDRARSRTAHITRALVAELFGGTVLEGIAPA